MLNKTIKDRPINKLFISVILTLLSLSSCVILRKRNVDYVEEASNLYIEMIEINGGAFEMGCDKNMRSCNEDELPLHKVVLEDFYIGKYEVSFSQYDIFCERTGREKPVDNGWGRGNRPVINVNWHDATAFCEWLSKVSGEKYRLPTEAEWEYAARGGNKSKHFLYSGSNNATKVAWFFQDTIAQSKKERHLNKTQLIGKKRPNELGIYDMSGNVWEWCYDGYDKYFYKKSPVNNPKGVGLGLVARGGSWYTNAEYCLITNRDYERGRMRDNDLGFRIVKIIK
jgi:formylglycine-generating enzyme required for sulfatase activity